MTRGAAGWRRYLRFWGRDIGADIQDELDFHIDMRRQEYEARGMSSDDARRAALARFGDVARIDAALQAHDERQDRATYVRRLAAACAYDVRHAIRTLRRAPGFTTAAILCLALGTGATASIFAVVNALLFQPLPVQRPGNLVRIGTLSSGSGLPGDNSYQNYLDIRNARSVLDDAAAWTSSAVSLRVGDRTDLRLAQMVSENYWPMLGVRPVLGRVFTPQEALQRAPMAVISYRFWQLAFAGTPSVVGRSIAVDGIPLTIVGVSPRTFVSAEMMIEPDLWVPATLLPQMDPSIADILERRRGGGFKIIGRLRSGSTLAGAQMALGVLAGQLQRQYPAENEGKTFLIKPELRARPDLAVTTIVPIIAGVFMALTALVLLIACANVTSLMLARANGRRTEMAVRAALGARRIRIVQQLLTESLVIAFAGGMGGVLLALGTAHWLAAVRFAGSVPVVFDVSLDWRVLAITAGAALLASVLSGVGPALRSSDPQLGEVLKDGSRGGSGIGHQRFRVGLVAGQIAVSFVLLVAAGLFLRSVQRARTLDLGFRQDHAFMATVDVSLARYDSTRGKAFYRALLAQAAQLPGVRAAALASTIPLGTSHGDVDVYADLPTLAQERGHTHLEVVAITPAYFDVMGVRLMQGRDFTIHDDSSAPRVVIVNTATAARLWPGGDPIGRRFKLAPMGPDVEVVGVAQTVMMDLLGERPTPVLYLPSAQRYNSVMTLHVRTEGDPQQFAEPLRALVASLDANVTPYGMRTMAEHLDLGIAFTPIRLAATLATAIGLLGLVLAVIGLYAIVAYSVAQRGREIGIRMALGATSGDILRDVLREGMVLTGAGLTIGLLLSLAVSGVLRGLVIGVNVRDPMTFGVLAAMLAVVTLIACLIPASQAARVPPTSAIRNG